MAAAPPTPPPARYWVKNEVGRVWGPFGLESIGRLDLGNGDVLGRIHISTDGRNFKPIGEHPEVLKAIEVARANTPVRRIMKEVKPSPEPEPPPPPPPPPVPRAPAPPPPEELKGPPPSGELSKHSMVELYSRAAGHQLTGKLSVVTANGTSALYFKKGTPERVEAPQLSGELAKFLVRRKAAAEAEVTSALELSGGPDGELLEGFYALGLVPPQDVFRWLGEFFVEQLERALALNSGEFVWDPSAAPPPGSFSLGNRWALLSDFARRQPAGVVRQRVGDRLRRNVYRSSGARASPEDLRLTAQETRIIAHLDGTRTAEEIALDLPGETDTVARVAWLLGEVGWLSFGDLRAAAGAPPPLAEDDAPVVEKVSALDEREKGAAKEGTVGIAKVAVKSVAVKAPPKEPEAPKAEAPKPAPKVEPPPKPEPPKSEPPKPPPPKITRPEPPKAPPRPPPVMNAASHTPAPATPPPAPPADSLEAMLFPTAEESALREKWVKANHFEVLGVGEKATTAEVKAAYYALAKLHHPDTALGREHAEELRQLKADLTSRLNEAYSVLGDDQARAKYLADLKSGAADQVDVGPILEAEETFMRATILVKARKYAEAVEMLDKAIALNPAEGEFLAWRAYAKFVQSQNKKLEYDAAVAECQKALKMNERCAPAQLFIGQMSKIVGEAVKAEKAFRAVLAIEPDNVEAKRELRLLGKA